MPVMVTVTSRAGLGGHDGLVLKWQTPRGLVLDERAVTWTALPSGGPGGQHANKADSAVEMTIRLTEAGLAAATTELLIARLGPVLTVRSADSRSQWRNRRHAWARAAARLDAAAVPPTARHATKPTRAAVSDRLAGKRRRSARKAARRKVRPDEE